MVLRLLTIGLIFACGDNKGLISIWDITSQENVATFECGSSGVTGLNFSQNGYSLVSSTVENVKIWDLRKSAVVKVLEHSQTESVQFDQTGSYLAVAGEKLTVYQTKTYSYVKEFKDHSDVITDAKFGDNCDYIASTSMDRNLIIYK